MPEDSLPDDPTPEPLRKTPLDSLHRELGARMVAFAGYSMPVQYPSGIMAEHARCRGEAALFDVSHMGQATLSGAGAAAALERLVPGDILDLAPMRQRYTLLMNEAGGIQDDLMVARLAPDRLLLVVNASRKDEDFRRIAADLRDVRLDVIEDRALLALQGPAAAATLASLAPGLAALPFLGVAQVDLLGAACIVSRSGYTGEDGFEISVPAARAEALARDLLARPGVAPAGLGARDILRLEAGLCLFGADIDELTTPVEAGLAWTIGKRRRAEGGYPGAAVVADQLASGPHRRRVGIRPDGRAPARAGATIAAADGTDAGTITSGGFSPTLGAPIAMGYVRKDLVAEGTRLALALRGRQVPAEVVKLPFVPHRYPR
jgi:aminomethyltransferase